MKKIIFFVMTVTLFNTLVFAQDLKNASDIPDIGHYPGFEIYDYYTTDYEEASYPVEIVDGKSSKTFKLEEITGKRTAIKYRLPDSDSVPFLKAYRSIERALTKNGYQIDITCVGSKQDCGFFIMRGLYRTSQLKKPVEIREFSNLNGEGFALITARKNNQRAILIFSYRIGRWFEYAVDYYELESLELVDLELTVNDMEQSLTNDGKIILTGVEFETDSADLTRNSNKTLATMAEFIKSNEGSYLIVGHTDAEGGYDYNLKLSSSRANAVKQALQSQHDIDRDRLKAIGIGYASPVSTNTTDEGRQQNRRVELVKE